MNRGTYTVATGMLAIQRAQEVLANNLANINTTAFKQDGLAFNDALIQQLSADSGGGPGIGSLGSGGEIKDEYTEFTDFTTQGSYSTTGNTLDVALKGLGMFAVRMPDGAIRYTRDGALAQTSDGTLVTKSGLPILDTNMQPITLPPGRIQIDSFGRVGLEAKPPVGQIALMMGNYAKEGLNLYLPAEGAADPVVTEPGTDGAGQFYQGVLEGSNVNAMAAMVQMIELNRMFELSQKSVQGQDEATQKLVSTMQ